MKELFDNWSDWFEKYLVSRFATKRCERGIMAEGLVFYSPRRIVEGKVFMAKLRRDMFRWYYSDKIRIDKEPRVDIS